MHNLASHLTWLLTEGGAHATFERAVDALPPNTRGETPDQLPWSPWMLIEHLRLCQWDIINFARDPDHVSPDWPDGYWPADPAPPSASAWDKSIQSFLADRSAMLALIDDEDDKLTAPIPHAPGYSILRQALLLADHNAYHIGQLIAVRRALNCWPPD